MPDGGVMTPPYNGWGVPGKPGTNCCRKIYSEISALLGRADHPKVLGDRRTKGS